MQNFSFKCNLFFLHLKSDANLRIRGWNANSTRKATTDAIIPSSQAANLNNADVNYMMTINHGLFKENIIEEDGV